MFNLQLRAAVLNEKNLSKSRFTLSWMSSSSFVPKISPGLWKIKFAGISRQSRYAQSLPIIFVKGNMVNTISSAGKRVAWFQTTSLNYIVRHVPNYSAEYPFTTYSDIAKYESLFYLNQERPTANCVSKYYIRSVSNSFLYAQAACYVSGLIWRLSP